MLVNPPDLTLPRLVTALHRIARIAAILPIAAGVLVLFGWSLQIESIKRIIPGLVAMNPATAIAFILLGVSLLLLARGDGAPMKIGKAVAAAVVLIACIKLLAIVSSIDLQIDQIFFRDRLDRADGGLPNRMAPNTALNFLLLGAALLLMDRPLRRVGPSGPTQVLAVIAAMSSLLALMGYAYGIRSFYGIGSYIPMALHTALTFFVSAVGVLCARPDRGITAVIASDSTGGALVRRLLPAVILIPAVLGWMRLAGQRAKLFDSHFGLWLLVVLIMSVLAVLVGWNGKLLYLADRNRTAVEQTLAHLATHDALTGLPNRVRLASELETALARARESSAKPALLFVDLDRFKVINDSLGHLVGDELLIAAGKRIAASLQSHEMTARIGGDEFTVLLPGVKDVQEAIDAARRIQTAFETSFVLGAHEVFTTVSIGIAIGEGDETPADLVRHADLAMYRAKTRGRARHEVFDPSLDVAASRRMELENGLRRALAQGELRVYYQPEVDIATGDLVGMEALVRWESPDRGIVPPSEFIAVAEETGLILPIGRWVLFEACRQSEEWEQRYGQSLSVSVNLSGRHFAQATLMEEVSEVIRRTGIAPSHLILEITETVAMEGAETTIGILQKLKELGVRLAIDDFGTGFSSLAYLKRFPVDFLKIDKSFVDGVAQRGHDKAIIRAVIALGHAIGVKMIAEGVESAEQLEQLRNLGSEIGQGYYFGAPLTGGPTGGFARLLSGTPHWMRKRGD